MSDPLAGHLEAPCSLPTDFVGEGFVSTMRKYCGRGAVDATDSTASWRLGPGDTSEMHIQDQGTALLSTLG